MPGGTYNKPVYQCQMLALVKSSKNCFLILLMTLIADITDTAIDSIVEGLETRSHAPMVTIQMQRVIRVVVACTASLPCCTAELVVFGAVKIPQALTTALKDSLYQSRQFCSFSAWLRDERTCFYRVIRDVDK